MGREIRRVTKDWEHPKNSEGHYIPLKDQTYEEAVAQIEADGDDYEPDPRYYRQAWTEEPTYYQMYENVSEGTPVSPVFETKDELVEWLVEQGHSRYAAREFAKQEYAPSMVIHDGKIAMGVDSYDLWDKDGK